MLAYFQSIKKPKIQSGQLLRATKVGSWGREFVLCMAHPSQSFHRLFIDLPTLFTSLKDTLNKDDH